MEETDKGIYVYNCRYFYDEKKLKINNKNEGKENYCSVINKTRLLK